MIAALQNTESLDLEAYNVSMAMMTPVETL